MITTIDLRGVRPSRTELLDMLPRPVVDITAAAHAALALIDDVRADGSEALLAQADRFDGGRPERIRVPQAEIDAAVTSLEPAVRAALVEAIDRVRTATQSAGPAGAHDRARPTARPSCSAGSRSAVSASTSRAGRPSTRRASS